jgi:hypothetical protein
MDWFEWDVRDSGSAASLLEAVAGLYERSSSSADHDLDRLLAHMNGTWARVFVYGTKERPEAVAPFMCQEGRVAVKFGHKVVHRIKIRRHTLMDGIVMDPSLEGDAASVQAGLFRALRPALARDEFVLVNVTAGSAMEQAVRGTRRGYFVQPHGRPYTRRFLEFPDGGYEEFLRGLSKRTREGLRRQERKLVKHCDGDVELQRYTTPDEVAAFLDAAVPVSQASWQWADLKLGLRNRENLEPTSRAAAEKGRFCSYVLRCRGEPVAYLYGFKHSGTYGYVDLAFDQAWKKWSVGSVLHALVFQDLMTPDSGVKRLDFRIGDGQAKQRFGNAERTDRLFYMIPKGPWNFARANMLTASDAVARLGKKILKR